MTPAPALGRVVMGMYPFGPLRAEYQALWDVVRHELDAVPARLEWDVDLHVAWRDPMLVLGQTCGWPLVTELADLVDTGRIRVVGTFAHTVPEADGPTYRAVIVARSPLTLAQLPGRRAAVNSFASLSGWVSLVHAVHGPGGVWAGTVTLTGAHYDSLLAVRDGQADVAAVDAVTLEHIRRLTPEVVDGLEVIGHGPRVPCLPVVLGPAASHLQVAQVRSAFTAALSGDHGAALRRALLVSDFIPLEPDDYRSLLELAPAPR